MYSSAHIRSMQQLEYFNQHLLDSASSGPFKYIFNNPIMHLYHHAKGLPANFNVGVNFAISLSIWDYIFKTNYVPIPDKDIVLGYENDHQMPSSFLGQIFYGFKKGD